MVDEDYVEEHADVPNTRSAEVISDSDNDTMSDAEGGFTQGAEGDHNYFDDEEEESALDDDEQIED